MNSYFSCSGICGTPCSLWSLAKSYRGVLKIWVVYCSLFMLLYYCIIYITYVYLYCLASILRSGSACHLDTAAGLLSVA